MEMNELFRASESIHTTNTDKRYWGVTDTVEQSVVVLYVLLFTLFFTRLFLKMFISEKTNLLEAELGRFQSNTISNCDEKQKNI